MPIIVNLDVMMAKRKISSGDLAEKIEITPANLSILKTGKAKAIRFARNSTASRVIFWSTIKNKRETTKRVGYIVRNKEWTI